MKKNKTVIFIDDSVDIGKEPLPINNKEAKKVHDELMKKYKKK